jgi:hypothetical protein
VPHPKKIWADGADQEGEPRSCFYCLEGWIFLGVLDHDGEEIVESIPCRRCGSMGRMHGQPPPLSSFATTIRCSRSYSTGSR